MLRTNRGGEFVSQAFSQYCNKHDIQQQFIQARTPHQNGIAERQN